MLQFKTIQIEKRGLRVVHKKVLIKLVHNRVANLD